MKWVKTIEVTSTGKELKSIRPVLLGHDCDKLCLNFELLDGPLSVSRVPACIIELEVNDDCLGEAEIKRSCYSCEVGLSIGIKGRYFNVYSSTYRGVGLVLLKMRRKPRKKAGIGMALYP